jgi:hypothetical protein
LKILRNNLFSGNSQFSLKFHLSPATPSGTEVLPNRFLGTCIERAKPIWSKAMKPIRTVFLCGATLMLLAGSAVAGPSTTSEREATRQLNLQASQAAPAVQNPVAPATQQSAQQTIAPIALNSLSSPPDKIATARVVDDSGTTVGAVQKVELGAGGSPTRVEIALLGSDRVVALDSRQLSYDEANNVVTAALDKSQLAQLPSAPQG